MPSSSDHDSSIMEFHHEEPELEIIDQVDKGIEIESCSNNTEATVRNVLSSSRPLTATSGVTTQNFPIYHQGPLRFEATTRNVPSYLPTSDSFPPTYPPRLLSSLPSPQHCFLPSLIPKPRHMFPALNSFESKLVTTSNENISAKIVKKIKAIDDQISEEEAKLKALKLKVKEVTIRNAIIVGENLLQTGQSSLAQKIYSENREKVKTNSCIINPLNMLHIPVYNQPSDTKVYHENIKKHASFNNRLISYLKYKKNETKKQNQMLTEKYASSLEAWKRRTNQIECSKERQEKKAIYKECFMRNFNEVQERKDINLKQLKEKMAIPPMLLHEKYVFLNRNSVIDAMAEYDKENSLNIWTLEEKNLFIKSFSKQKKDFRYIASQLENKSISDCIKFYYLNKHSDNFLRSVIDRKKKVLKKRHSSRKSYLI